MARETKKHVKITERCHSRLSEHKRSGETLSGAIERGLDALEREGELPAAVTEVLRDGGE